MSMSVFPGWYLLCMCVCSQWVLAQMKSPCLVRATWWGPGFNTVCVCVCVCVCVVLRSILMKPKFDIFKESVIKVVVGRYLSIIYGESKVVCCLRDVVVFMCKRGQSIKIHVCFEVCHPMDGTSHVKLTSVHFPLCYFGHVFFRWNIYSCNILFDCI